MTRLPAQDIEQIVRATTDAWQPLRGGTVLVTGATGFFGRWLLESMAAANRELGLNLKILAQSRDPDAFLKRVPHLGADHGVRWLKAHPLSLDEKHLRAATGLGQLDAVVHLVTEADNAKLAAGPDEAEETIVGSTREALALARKTRARHFLFTSSGSVYAPKAEAHSRFNEDDPLLEPSSGPPTGHEVGGLCKRRGEELCFEAMRDGGIGAMVARCFAFVGPGIPLAGKFALGNFMNDALQGRDIVVQGNGLAIRSYLYAADLTIWLWTILLRGKPGRSYNVGSENALTIREAAETVRDTLASTRTVQILGEAKSGVGACYVPDTRRAREELQLRETVGLAEAVRRTAMWAKGDTRHLT